MGKSLGGITLLCEVYNMRTSKELPFYLEFALCWSCRLVRDLDSIANLPAR